MKRFIVRALLFLLIATGVIVLTHWLNSYLIRTTAYRVNDDVVTLITGNSTLQYGVNPKFIPHSDNISVESEPLFMSYYKIKELLKQNRSIKNVVIPFSIHDARKVNDDYLNQLDDAWKKELYSRICFLENPIPFTCLKDYGVNSVLYGEIFLRDRVFPNFFFISRRIRFSNNNCAYLSHIGQFKPMSLDTAIYVNSFTEEYIDAAIKYKFFYDGIEQKYSTYLDSIANLCTHYGTRMIVVNMPMYPEFKQKISNVYKVHYYSTISRLLGMFDVDFLDYSSLIQDHIYFRDEIHLNSRGAELLSKKMASDIGGL